MLSAIVFTDIVSLPWLSRYDWLFLFAVAIQIAMVKTGLERPREVITICAFHLVGLGMELFKTHPAIGSWSYPGDSIFRIGTVPLFSGFMYAAVGSYMARAWRVLDLRFTRYPSPLWTVVLAVAIYINFFTHHFVTDIRLVLFAAMALLYGRSTVHFVLTKTNRSMPLIVGFGLIAGVIYAAENVATLFSVWLYPDQAAHWQIVHPGKYGSWLLLMVISFVLVDVLHRFENRHNPK